MEYANELNIYFTSIPWSYHVSRQAKLFWSTFTHIYCFLGDGHTETAAKRGFWLMISVKSNYSWYKWHKLSTSPFQWFFGQLYQPKLRFRSCKSTHLVHLYPHLLFSGWWSHWNCGKTRLLTDDFSQIELILIKVTQTKYQSIPVICWPIVSA